MLDSDNSCLTLMTHELMRCCDASIVLCANKQAVSEVWVGHRVGRGKFLVQKCSMLAGTYVAPRFVNG